MHHFYCRVQTYPLCYYRSEVPALMQTWEPSAGMCELSLEVQITQPLEVAFKVCEKLVPILKQSMRYTNKQRLLAPKQHLIYKQYFYF